MNERFFKSKREEGWEEREKEIERKKEVLNRVFQVSLDIMSKKWDCVGHLGIPGTEKYLLLDKFLGVGTENNSFFTMHQFEMALALGKREVIDRFLSFEIKKEKSKKEQLAFEFQKMIDNKPLTGVKILDLGCGGIPSFARVARASGGNIYTVDIFDAEHFEYKDREMVDPKIIEEERENHIKLDLEKPESLEVLKQKTGGNFDLVTFSHLSTPGSTRQFKGDAYKLSIPLLKDNGIVFNATNDFGGIKLSDNEYVGKRRTQEDNTFYVFSIK